MLVTLVSKTRLYSLHLPERISGKFWITDDEKSMGKNLLLSVEATGDKKWIVKEQKNVKIFDEKFHLISEVILEEDQLYPVEIAGKGECVLYTEKFSEDRRIFQKYIVQTGMSFHIGKKEDNDIVINNRFVSGHHAKIEYRNGVWYLWDKGAVNGTYVNRTRIEGEKTLAHGDVVSILGFKIIVGSGFFAINNPNHEVTFHSENIVPFPPIEVKTREEIELAEQEFYYRSPRFRKQIFPLSLKVDMPPQKDTSDQQPILLTIGPAIFMGAASFTVALITLLNAYNEGRSLITVIPTMIMAVSMLIGMIVFPIIVNKRVGRLRKEKEKERREKYLKYLRNIRAEIEKAQEQQKEILFANYPLISEYAKADDFWERRLWSKTKEQEDFLSLRIGIGNAPMAEDIRFPEERFSIDDDVLRDEVLALQKEEHLLTNVPIRFSLMQSRVFGLIGEKESIYRVLSDILLQVFLLHSYDEVKLICLLDEGDEQHLSFLRYAKHLWDDEEKERYLAITEDNLRELSIRVNQLISKRKEEPKDRLVNPHYIILTTSRVLSNQCDFLQEVLSDGNLQGFSVICAYDEVKSLPKECKTFVEVSGTTGKLYDEKMSRFGAISFVQDDVTKEDAIHMVYRMTNKSLDLTRGRYDLPDVIKFLDMLGVSRCEHLNIRERWRKNDPVKSLRAAVGIDTNGLPFYLDLHEKLHGPHGLVAGMTGSGKSEFIITYILSMAINYHPNEVAFVLIDYKGGGLVDAFENEKYRLPHLAGTITNLDGDSIMRSILSVESELKRRQTIFREARAIANEGTMDIYKYQRMYRDGQVSEPLPHLIIVADEFAELKSQHVEFMDQLISTARIGRSLGVHLILATQKPAGVVNDQIWANSRFKVCLKVQDKTDSNDMLKRPDAAELKETGRFYLQVGYNELFEMGQSAWSGAPYWEQESVDNLLDSNMEIIDELGNTVDKIRTKKTETTEATDTQVVRIMEYLNAIAKEDGLTTHQLWLPELNAVISMDELGRKYHSTLERKGLTGIVGEIDDPYRQRQQLFSVDMEEAGNICIYGAVGSGKEMFLQALLYSLYNAYSPLELNCYVLDFDAETLRVFENAPQTGGVIIDGENDKIKSFFELIQKEVKLRKKKFAEYGGDYTKYRAAGNTDMPYILVLLHNYSHFYESYEQYEDIMVSVTRECPKYGIYFVVTATGASGIRYRLLQNFSSIYVMQLNDMSDYSTILGRTGGVYPSKYRGRGIMKTDETYVFQTASLTERQEDQIEYLRNAVRKWQKEYPNAKARCVPTVPKFVSGKSLSERFPQTDILPVGISFHTYDAETIQMDKRNLTYALGMDDREMMLFTGGIIEAVTEKFAGNCVVINGGEELQKIVDVPYKKVDGDMDTCIVDLFEKAVERNNNYKDTDGHPTVDMTPMIIIVCGFGKLLKALSENACNKLRAMLAKTPPFVNMYFVITDNYRASGQYSADEWVTDRMSGDGIWIGMGLEDQIRFTVQRSRALLNTEQNTGIAFLIERGAAKKMRMVMPESAEEVMMDEA